MRVDFSRVLRTIEGDTLYRSRLDRATKASVELPATARWAAVEALLSVRQGDIHTGEEKAHRYNLALRIQNADGPVSLPIEDAALLKHLCDDHFPPLIVGQMRKLLDGEELP